MKLRCKKVLKDSKHFLFLENKEYIVDKTYIAGDKKYYQFLDENGLYFVFGEFTTDDYYLFDYFYTLQETRNTKINSFI